MLCRRIDSGEALLMEPTPDRLLGVFREAQRDRPLTTAEIADVVGSSEESVAPILEELEDADVVEARTVGDGVRLWWRSGIPAVELTAEQMVELEFSSKALAAPFLEASNGSFTVSIDSLVELPDGESIQYYTATGIDASTYIALIEAVPSVRRVRLLSVVDDTCRVEVRTTQDGLAAVFSAYDGQMSGVALDAENEEFRVVGIVKRGTRTADLLESLRQSYPDFEVVDERLVYTPRLFRDIIAARMSERQWATLEAAYFAGYFASPRTSNGDQLAATMGVTRQTFNYHLRRAEAVLLELLFEGTAMADHI